MPEPTVPRNAGAPMAVTVGFLPRVPFSENQSISAVNISSLKNMARSARYYRHMLTARTETVAMALGTAAHAAILEPARFDAEFATWDERTEAGDLKPRKGKAWDAFVVSHLDKTIIRAPERDAAAAMRESVLRNDDAARYLSAPGDAELSMLWADVETGRPCRGRIDWMPKGSAVIVGLKTSRDCRPILFGNQAAKLGYHLQWAFYHDGYEALTGDSPRMVEIVIESKPPFDVAVYVIPPEVLDQGRAEYRRLLHALIACERFGDWPGAVVGEQILTLPSWAYSAEDDIAVLGLEVA